MRLLQENKVTQAGDIMFRLTLLKSDKNTLKIEQLIHVLKINCTLMGMSLFNTFVDIICLYFGAVC